MATTYTQSRTKDGNITSPAETRCEVHFDSKAQQFHMRMQSERVQTAIEVWPESRDTINRCLEAKIERLNWWMRTAIAFIVLTLAVYVIQIITTDLFNRSQTKWLLYFSAITSAILAVLLLIVGAICRSVWNLKAKLKAATCKGGCGKVSVYYPGCTEFICSQCNAKVFEPLPTSALIGSPFETQLRHAIEPTTTPYDEPKP